MRRTILVPILTNLSSRLHSRRQRGDEMEIGGGHSSQNVTCMYIYHHCLSVSLSVCRNISFLSYLTLFLMDLFYYLQNVNKSFF